MRTPAPSVVGASRRERVARLLASPAGVLVIVPAMIVLVGIIVLSIGRAATRDASESMARHQLAAQAADVRRDVANALDEAGPLVVALRSLADEALPIAQVAVRLRELQIGRPGITGLSVAFASGVSRETYRDGAEIRVAEEAGGTRTNYAIDAAGAVTVASVVANGAYAGGARARPAWIAAERAKQPVWMPPTGAHPGGIALAAPIVVGDRTVAVVAVDFEVGALSSVIGRSPLPLARTVVFTADGAILAAPGVAPPALAAPRVVRAEDYGDPAIAALFTAVREGRANVTAVAGGGPGSTTMFHEGDYLVSVAPIGGVRAGVAAPLDWYFAELVPDRALVGPTERFQRETLVASGGALAVAVAIALLFAWNLARMQRAVASARDALRSAEARAKDLGSYRLMSRLGAGGMGEVWRAEHRLLARQAAIKLVRRDALRDPLYALKMRERFRREAQVLAAMRSRNTIALHDYGVTDDGTFYFVMELLDGVDLDKLVKEHGPVPAARAIAILVQACGSLAEAHEAGLLHRDIKPANLFVARMAAEVDVVKVLDFGIVQHLREPTRDPVDIVSLGAGPSTSGRLTSADAVVGTPGYIAPEAAFGADVDARADLYALGCVAWWLLTGGEVFPRGKTDVATLDAHMYDDVPALRERVKGWLPIELEQLVTAMLAKRPQERPASAQALIDELRAIPIPAEHAWTETRAQAWWFAHQPAAPARGDLSDRPIDAPTSTIERFVVTDRMAREAAASIDGSTLDGVGVGAGAVATPANQARTLEGGVPTVSSRKAR